MSVVRYLLRATSRATPFGLFAGVAPTRFGPELRVRYGEQHHATALSERLALVDDAAHEFAANDGHTELVTTFDERMAALE